ncbi:Uncharacterised protein [uncultured archaeon]|nr:Uncharacterised protein [uncultured archaeon]
MDLEAEGYIGHNSIIRLQNIYILRAWLFIPEILARELREKP